MANWLKDEMSEGKAHAQDLIVFAADEFGKVLDNRIEKMKLEVGELITEKLSEVRREMSEAADIQKRSAVRNMTIAIFSALAVALISLIYRKSMAGSVDPYTVFRSVVMAAAVGHGIWLVARGVSNWINASKLKKDAAFYMSQYLGVFQIKGIAGHLVVFVIIVAMWGYFNFFVGG